VPTLASLVSSDLDVVYGDAVDGGRRRHQEFVKAIGIFASQISRRPCKSGGTDEVSARVGDTLSNLIPRQEIRDLPAQWSRESSEVRRFVALQTWTGTVIERRDKQLFVRLFDETTHGAPESEVAIRIEEIDDTDMHLVKPGAIFYWNIGYHDAPSGRERTSIIRFRRIPAWNKRDEGAALELRDELLTFFGTANGNDHPRNSDDEARSE
jgi:hypothetical protein